MSISSTRLFGDGLHLSPSSGVEIINPLRARTYSFEPSTSGLKAQIIDARDLPLGMRVYLRNIATDDFEIENNAGGTEIAALEEQMTAEGFLVDNTTQAGTWLWRTRGGGGVPPEPEPPVIKIVLLSNVRRFF